MRLTHLLLIFLLVTFNVRAMDKGKGISSTSRNDEEQPLSNEMANREVDHHGENPVEARDRLMKLSQEFEDAAKTVELIIRQARSEHHLLKNKMTFIATTIVGPLRDDLKSLRVYFPHEYLETREELQQAFDDFETLIPEHVAFKNRVIKLKELLKIFREESHRLRDEASRLKSNLVKDRKRKRIAESEKEGSERGG